MTVIDGGKVPRCAYCGSSGERLPSVLAAPSMPPKMAGREGGVMNTAISTLDCAIDVVAQIGG